MTDLMIDLETLGTDPDAPVMSLGAVFFDTATKTLGPTFYLPIDVKEQIKRGRKPSGDTLQWWMGQDGAAKIVFKEQAKPTLYVLQTFAAWFKVNGAKCFVWGNGSTFDISLMEDLFRMYGVECPWDYNKIQDLRTFKRFQAKGAKVPKPLIPHHALEDAKTQAQYVLDHL